MAPHLGLALGFAEIAPQVVVPVVHEISEIGDRVRDQNERFALDCGSTWPLHRF